jgi:hypothetical protein
MAELYAAGLGEEWQIVLLGRRCDGVSPTQMLVLCYNLYLCGIVVC